jgi:hypothetical protein
MIFGKPEPLSAEAERLLAHERDLVAAAPELQARVLARARMAAGKPIVLGPRPWTPARVLPLAGLGIVVASVSFAAWHEAQSGDPVATPRPIAPAFVQAVPPADSLERPADDVLVVPEVPVAAKSAGGSHQVQSQSTTPVVDAELSLLQRARLAVNRGAHASAMSDLTEHQRRFPASRLREEREALRIRALEGLGKSEDARRAADKFRQRYPKSVLSPQLGEAGRGQ